MPAGDLLGYADAPFAVTTRPADSRVFGVVDTWGKDCSAPGANDGTFLSAAFMNGMLAQVRRAIRGMGITEDNTDDDMLLKAIQAIAALSVPVASARLYMPVFPIASAASGLIGSTSSTGQVIVSAGQTFIHRGLFLISTDNYLAAARTFVTAANKVYHLRWQWNAGVPAFALKDVADVTYNPTSLAETNAIFDSTYDDMLIAKVVTNGSNVPTVTPLINKDRLVASVVRAATFAAADSWNWTAMPNSSLTLGWARTPSFCQPILQGFSSKGLASGPDGVDPDSTPVNVGAMVQMFVRSPTTAGAVNRYGVNNVEYSFDDDENTSGTAQFCWHASA